MQKEQESGGERQRDTELQEKERQKDIVRGRGESEQYINARQLQV